ncbi:MAG: phosphate ABC transporter substrate-binding protein PstS [Actinomycetes bacterium]
MTSDAVGRKTVAVGRTVGIACVGIAGALALAGCGSSSSSSSNPDNISCATGSIKASGSSAQKNAMSEWVNAYQSACTGSTIEYQANGSGAGIIDFNNSQTSFAGTDSAVKDADLTAANTRCGGGPAINIPMVGGAITAAYNVSGVSSLILTPGVLAKIFSNKITTWNDPAIAAINPGVALPSAAIVQFHRSDSSGTTDNFTKYLAATAKADWTTATGKDWVAPGGQGAKGNDGVAAAVKSTANAIGYMELSFAQDAKLNVASIDNGGGPVAPTAATGSAAIALATVTGTGNNLALSIDYATKAPGAYPLVLVTYEFTCQKGLPSGQVTLTKSFLTYTASAPAQAKLATAGYVPIPTTLLTKVNTAVAAIS